MPLSSAAVFQQTVQLLGGVSALAMLLQRNTRPTTDGFSLSEGARACVSSSSESVAAFTQHTPPGIQLQLHVSSHQQPAMKTANLSAHAYLPPLWLWAAGLPALGVAAAGESGAAAPLQQWAAACAAADGRVRPGPGLPRCRRRVWREHMDPALQPCLVLPGIEPCNSHPAPLLGHATANTAGHGSCRLAGSCG
ncbi:hypothetical protein COO60DRAFT_647187 [Scenedesmus sp. NREL 46B-D3]|nr:hypothetical protein COO60DRAFT_647187 [Scenedesmus sp. NREL 46B-D3]